MIRYMTAIGILCVGSAVCFAETPPPVLALNGLDPIDLVSGKESPGVEAVEASFGRFKYRFASAENKKTFLANPEKHAIQFGGACGRMGPFSGTGNPARYFVYRRQIYIFASESCRDSFIKDPEQHIERPNDVPTFSDEERKQGVRRIERALEGFGGAKVVDSLKTLERVEKIVYRQKDSEVIGMHRATWVFPDAVRMETGFGTPYGHVLKNGGGFETYGKQAWTLEPAMRDVAWRQALREPLTMLCNRSSKGFVAAARGENQVEVALAGATCLWTLEGTTGRVIKVEYTGRRGTVGANAVAYSDFKPVNGIMLPHVRKESFNGKEISRPEQVIQTLKVNLAVKPELFLQPK